MDASGIVFDHMKLDTLNVVRCGLMSFCVDADGNAGDCGFLGYGSDHPLSFLSNPNPNPYPWWL